MINGKSAFTFLFFYSCCYLFVFPFTGLCADSSATKANLQGPAFSKVSENQKIMPPDWRQKKIHYPPKYEGLDILMTLDQNIYPLIKPFINNYAFINRLKIHIIQGTCGITAGLLTKKQMDIGGL